MPRCIVQGCPHYSGRKNSTPGVSFHMFPKNLTTIKKWLLQINQNIGDVGAFAQGVLEGKAGVIRICSAHFAMECYRFVGSQKILLEDAVPTLFLGKPSVKAESIDYTMIFPEKEKMAIKVESAVRPMFVEKEKTAIKVEVTRPLKHQSNKGNSAARSIPDMGKLAASTEGAIPPLYWNMQALQMPIFPLLNMANPLWTSNSLGITNLDSWSANTLANGGSNIGQIHKEDTLAPKIEAENPEKYVKNVIGTDDFPDMRDAESHGRLPSAIFGEKDVQVSGCPVNSAVQREDKAVQWPECETSGLAWKVHHDHYYKVRRAIDRSALRDGIENCYKEMDSEGELLAILQYVSSVLWRNRRKRELKTARILNQTLEIITLVTGEEWVIVKKDSIHKGVHELTGEVPVKCGNVAVFFTLDEWSYIERHRQEYAETVANNGPIQRTWRVQEHWDSEEEYFSGVEEEAGVEDSPKKKSSPEYKPSCVSLESAEEEEKDDLNHPKTAENGVEGESEPETSRSAPLMEETHYRCDACGEHLTSKEDMIRHKAVNHAVKRYPCPICGIQYDYKSQFIIHQRAHTGEKPFVCQECGARFGHKSSYLVHERRHKKGKTFECDKCDRRFDKKCELVKHEKTHDQKKRHKCHKCGKRYSSRSALMRHKWAHKGE